MAPAGPGLDPRAGSGNRHDDAATTGPARGRGDAMCHGTRDGSRGLRTATVPAARGLAPEVGPRSRRRQPLGHARRLKRALMAHLGMVRSNGYAFPVQRTVAVASEGPTDFLVGARSRAEPWSHLWRSAPRRSAGSDASVGLSSPPPEPDGSDEADRSGAGAPPTGGPRPGPLSEAAPAADPARVGQPVGGRSLLLQDSPVRSVVGEPPPTRIPGPVRCRRRLYPPTGQDGSAGGGWPRSGSPGIQSSPGGPCFPPLAGSIRGVLCPRAWHGPPGRHCIPGSRARPASARRPVLTGRRIEPPPTTDRTGNSRRRGSPTTDRTGESWRRRLRPPTG